MTPTFFAASSKLVISSILYFISRVSASLSVLLSSFFNVCIVAGSILNLKCLDGLLCLELIRSSSKVCKTDLCQPLVFKFSSNNLSGISARKTPLSNASTWPPTYVSLSIICPSFVYFVPFCTLLLGKMILFWYAFTISSASHKVPDPLRSTWINRSD